MPMPENIISPFYSVTDIARILGVSRTRAYALVDAGRVPYVRLSTGRIRVPKAAWDQWVADQAEEALKNVQTSA